MRAGALPTHLVGDGPRDGELIYRRHGQIGIASTCGGPRAGVLSLGVTARFDAASTVSRESAILFDLGCPAGRPRLGPTNLKVAVVRLEQQCVNGPGRAVVDS